MSTMDIALFFNHITLTRLLNENADSTQWGAMVKRIADCSVVNKDTIVVYQELAKICAIAEKEALFLNLHLDRFDELLMVRAVTYAVTEDPEVLSKALESMEEAKIFQQLSDAWSDADEVMAQRYAAIMTALQAFDIMTIGVMPELDAEVEKALLNEIKGTPAQKETKPELHDEPIEKLTFDVLKERFLGDESLYDVYIQGLNAMDEWLVSADELFEQINPEAKKTYNYRTAFEFMECVNRIENRDTILSLPVVVDPGDQSLEACKYRAIVPYLDSRRKELREKLAILAKVDPDMERKYKNYLKFKWKKEDLNDPIANRAQLLSLLPENITMEIIEDRAKGLRELAKAGQYPHGFAMAAKLYMLAIDNYERNPGSNFGGTLGHYGCKTELVNCLTDYYFVSFKMGGEVLERCESDIFYGLYSMYDVKYQYLRDLQENIVEECKGKDQTVAAAEFIKWMKLYQAGDQRDKKTTQALQKAFDKLTVKKPKVPAFIGVALFAAVWYLVGRVGVYSFLNASSSAVAYFSILIPLAVLTCAQTWVMKTYIKSTWVVRIIAVILSVLVYSTGTAISFEVSGHQSWYPASGAEVVGVAVLMLYLPCISLSFVPNLQLYTFPAHVKSGRMLSYIAVMAIYLVAAGLCVGKSLSDSGFLNFVQRGGAIVVMYMIATATGLPEDLVYNAFEDHPSQLATTLMYLSVLALAPMYLFPGVIPAYGLCLLFLIPSMLLAQIGARNSLI